MILENENGWLIRSGEFVYLKNENGWLIDGNENKWSIEFFGGIEEAKIAAESCEFDRKSFNNINCSKIYGCSKISDCRRVSDFRRVSDSHGLSDCSRIYDCKNLSSGDVQFFATGKYTLTIYNDICQVGCAKKTLQEWLNYAGDELNSDDKKYFETWTKPIIRTVLESRKLNNKEGEGDE